MASGDLLHLFGHYLAKITPPQIIQLLAIVLNGRGQFVMTGSSPYSLCQTGSGRFDELSMLAAVRWVQAPIQLICPAISGTFAAASTGLDGFLTLV